jgi:RNA polymerase sigma factor (sigma-70 family)
MSTVGASINEAAHQAGPGLACPLAAVPTFRERSEEPSIASLVERARCGDRAGWDGLVDKFSSTVWAIARGHRLSAADAADVSQTTWLRLVENLDRIEQPDRVGAWLATTARRESLRLLRLAGRQIPDGEGMELIADPAPASEEQKVFNSQAEEILTHLVEQLPRRSQLLIRLLSADTPLSYKEISESLDMPIGSIGPTRARALAELRKLAVKAGFDPEDVLA